MAQATNDTAEEYPELPAGLTPRQLAKHIYVRAKICESCHQQKADNDSEFESGSNVCRVCQDCHDQLAGLPVKRKALGRVLDAIEKGYSVPQSSDLLGFYYKEFKGPAGVAKESKRVFDRAMATDDTKVAARILHTITQLQVKVSSDSQKMALATMSPEELEEHSKHLESKILEALMLSPTVVEPPRLEGDNA